MTQRVCTVLAGFEYAARGWAVWWDMVVWPGRFKSHTPYSAPSPLDGHSFRLHSLPPACRYLKPTDAYDCAATAHIIDYN
eukprot:5708565-Pyramimonas_sp.AAC.1